MMEALLLAFGPTANRLSERDLRTASLDLLAPSLTRSITLFESTLGGANRGNGDSF